MNKFTLPILLGCLLGGTGCADRIQTPSITTTTERIVYTKSDNSLQGSMQNHEMFVVDTNSLNATSLGIGEITGIGGGKIVYFGLDIATNQAVKIVVANSDGTNPKTVFTPSDPSQVLKLSLSPIMSPDGSQVCYVIEDLTIHASHLFVVGSDGSGTLEVAKNVFLGTLPTFSPDGMSIAYFTRNSTTFAPNTLETIQINGNNVHDLCAFTKGISDQGIPNISWSSNGTIAFADGGTVYTIPADGSRKEIPLDIGQHPLWSPDGTILAYVTGIGSTDIVLTSDLGVTKQNITNTSTLNEDFPCWSPDGKHVVCLSWTGTFFNSTTSLKMVNVSTASSSIIATPALFAYFLK